MINKDKQYRTRVGNEVRIYATDAGGLFPVHGAIFNDGLWNGMKWNVHGEIYIGAERVRSGDDLIEVKPRIKRTFWMNVYPENDIRPYEDKYVADACESLRSVMGNVSRRIACVKVEIDCEEGEGL
jgi:hypothetical protein